MSISALATAYGEDDEKSAFISQTRFWEGEGGIRARLVGGSDSNTDFSSAGYVSCNKVGGGCLLPPLLLVLYMSRMERECGGGGCSLSARPPLPPSLFQGNEGGGSAAF